MRNDMERLFRSVKNKAKQILCVLTIASLLAGCGTTAADPVKENTAEAPKEVSVAKETPAAENAANETPAEEAPAAVRGITAPAMQITSENLHDGAWDQVISNTKN